MNKTLLLAAALAWAAHASAGVLSYPVHKKTLPNGLDVVVVETPEFKDVLSFNTLIMAGSGKEEEKGASGLAHLFEHILFRHRAGGVEGGYDDAMTRLGTHNNAWTSSDVTFYHPLTFARNLADVAALEGGRFVSLDFSEKTFKTEAGAVLGEYRRGASSPSQKMDETLCELQWPGHPYGHTTIGYFADVQAMPEHFGSAKAFYDTWYRPNNAAVVVVGDVKADDAFAAVERTYGAWKPQAVPSVKAPAAREPGERRGHVAWDSDVAPALWVSYRTPAFTLGSRSSAAALLLPELLVSPAAPLYKKLRYEKQTASELGTTEGASGLESDAPRALTVAATLFKDKHAQRGGEYFSEVERDIEEGVEALKDFSKQPAAKELLETVKSKYRYDFLAGLSSPERIGSTLAWYYRFTRDPAALDALLGSVAQVEPADIDAFAREHFNAEGRAVVTMAAKEAE